MKIAVVILSSFLVFSAVSTDSVESGQAITQTLVLSDAENFAAVFRQFDEAPSPEQLQTNYLNPGSMGVKIFTPYRIIDANNLAKTISSNRDTYSKALSVCLPAVRSLSEESELIMREVAELIGEKEIAPAYVVFGANNSGGTASSEGLVIGIEVLCKMVKGKDEFSLLFQDFIAHEIVHVYQNRLSKIEGDLSLLDKVVIEGVADFIAEKVLGRVSSSAVERTDYGLKHEAALWHEFKADMDSKNTGEWMYQLSTTAGRPADLGYWIGKRIAEAYYTNSTDKNLALRELVVFSNAQEILIKSQYGEKFNAI